MADLLAQLEELVDELVAVDVHAMAEGQTLTHTEALLTLQARLDGATAVALQSVDVRCLTVTHCAQQPKAWLVQDQHPSVAEAGRRMWVARQLPYYPAIRAALLAGEVTHEHVRVIIGCLLKLPGDWAASSEAELLEFARHHDPGLLGRLCEELRVRTGADDDAEAAAARKHADRHVSLDETYGGMFAINGVLDPAAGAALRAALESLMTREGPEDTRTADQARADALAELAELALTYGELPEHGGERPTVIVTISFQELLNGIPATHLSAATVNGLPITPSTARMIACDANILPAVLGGESEVLDLGRSHRQFSRAQRRAMRLRDGETCAWPSRCHTPIWRCHAHHINQWAADHGPTNIDNGIHLCRFHHWLIHHTNWTLWRDDTGKLHATKPPAPTDQHHRQPGNPDPWDHPDPPPKT